MRPALLLPLAVALTGCASALPRARLTIATVTSSNMFGGEALFTGKLLEQNGCLLASANERFATLIFDPGVTLAADGGTIRDVRQNVEVPVGRYFRAGSAWLRDGGQGWSVADIEAFYGTRIPAKCPTHNVIRLHDFDLTEQGEKMNGFEGNGR